MGTICTVPKRVSVGTTNAKPVLRDLRGNRLRPARPQEPANLCAACNWGKEPVVSALHSRQKA